MRITVTFSPFSCLSQGTRADHPIPSATPLWEDRFVYGMAKLRSTIPPLNLEAPDTPPVSEQHCNASRLAHVVDAARYLTLRLVERQALTALRCFLILDYLITELPRWLLAMRSAPL